MRLTLEFILSYELGGPEGSHTLLGDSRAGFRICLLRGQRLKAFIAPSESSGYFLPSSLASCLLGHCLPPRGLGIPADCPTGANCRLLGISSYFQSGINHFHQVPGELSLWISLVSRDKLGPRSLSFSLCSLLSS